jgi:hypothetical protein
MTTQVLSEKAMCEVLDALASGYKIREAAESVGLTESAIWTWRRKSRLAEEACDFTQFYITWQNRLNFFHVLEDVAKQPRRKPLPVSPPHYAVSEQSSDADTLGNKGGRHEAAGKPLPPYARGLKTAALPSPPKPMPAPGKSFSPFPPPITPSSPRVRPNSPLVRDLLARAALAPANPHPLDRSGRRTIPSMGGMRADDPLERVTGQE